MAKLAAALDFCVKFFDLSDALDSLSECIIYTYMRKDITKMIDHQIKDWIIQGRSKNWMCKQLNCRPSTLESHLTKNGIEYRGNMGEKGFKKPANKKHSSYFLNSDQIIPSSKLRKKLLEDGIKEEKCETCGNDSWIGQKIPLDLHHIDGNRFNNKIENLQVICKNCHGLTPNHSKSRSKKSKSN